MIVLAIDPGSETSGWVMGESANGARTCPSEMTIARTASGYVRA